MDILAIQEAHCSDNLVNSWKDTFYPKVSYWTHYCAFIISPNFQHSNFQRYCINGQKLDRIISIDISINSTPYTLINIYAPNNYIERNEFFKEISKFKMKSFLERIINSDIFNYGNVKGSFILPPNGFFI